MKKSRASSRLSQTNSRGEGCYRVLSGFELSSGGNAIITFLRVQFSSLIPRSLNQLETADADRAAAPATSGSSDGTKVPARGSPLSSGSTSKADKTAAALECHDSSAYGTATSAGPCSYSIYAAYGKALVRRRPAPILPNDKTGGVFCQRV